MTGSQVRILFAAPVFRIQKKISRRKAGRTVACWFAPDGQISDGSCIRLSRPIGGGSLHNPGASRRGIADSHLEHLQVRRLGEFIL
jgi:hypothetical protein